MKESYKEGSSDPPWPRVMRSDGNRKDEAFTGVKSGRVLSSENNIIWVADLLVLEGRQEPLIVNARESGPHGV